MTTVSTVIPVYNRAHLIGAAIESVLAQSWPVSEIIVVDDGSTDRTAAVVEGYPQVRLIRQRNSGPGAARNRGMREASGEYIAFLDSDDLWPADKNRLQLEFLARHPEVEFLFGDMANFSGTEDSDEPEIKNREIHDYFVTHCSNLEDLLPCLIRENVIPTPTVMLKHTLIDKVGFFDEGLKVSEDLDYWLRAARTCRCGFVNAVLCRRRRHDGNLINDWVKRTQSLTEVLGRLEGLPALSSPTRRTLKTKLEDTHYDLGSYFFKRLEFDDALRHLRHGVPARWLNPKWLIKGTVSMVGRRLPLPFGARSSPVRLESGV